MATLESRGIEVNPIAMNITRVFATQEFEFALESSLSSSLFGILTTLAFLSVCLLLRRPRGPSRYRAIKIPLSGTILLYISTSVYMAAYAWNRVSMGRLVSEATGGLSSPTYGRTGLSIYLEAVLKQSRMATASLGANIVLGDAIVWWRACVIWPHKAIYWTGAILVTLTLGFSAIGAGLNGGQREWIAINFIFGAEAFTTVAVALSFVTNLAATSLIAYKAWFHRRRLKRYLGEYTTQTRVLKVLIVLVESGSIYSVILVVVLVFQPQQHQTTSPSDPGLYFLYGCLVPIVAIYPTVIIVLTADNSSPLERGLSEVGPDVVGPDYGKQRDPLNELRPRRCMFCNFEGPTDEDLEAQDGGYVAERVTSRNSSQSSRDPGVSPCPLETGEPSTDIETSARHSDSSATVT